VLARSQVGEGGLGELLWMTGGLVVWVFDLAALAQAQCDLREDAVTGGMAVAVVDPLEVVHVDEAQAERLRRLLLHQFALRIGDVLVDEEAPGDRHAM